MAKWIILAVAILVALTFLRQVLKMVFRLLGRTMVGLVGLLVFSQVGGLIGVSLGVNLLNALVLGVLGIPGFGLLLMLNWALQLA